MALLRALLGSLPAASLRVAWTAEPGSTPPAGARCGGSP